MPPTRRASTPPPPSSTSSDDGESDYRRFEETGPRSPTSTPAWAKRNENVRDLHRSLLQPSELVTTSRSVDDLKRPAHVRLHPEIGTASELAQPGGFRRAHLVGSSSGQNSLSQRTLQYCTVPLVDMLEREGFIHHFVTTTVQRLADGTEVIYRSRPYRRGAPPRIARAPTGEEVEPPAIRLRFLGFRPASVPYWSSLSFLLGAILFSEGSFVWWAAGTASAPAWAVTYPFFYGGLCFLSGCYLAFVEVINANLSEDLAAGALRKPGDSPRRGERLSWWKYQPHSLLWWGAFTQLVGAISFQVSLNAEVPELAYLYGPPSAWRKAVWVDSPSAFGSACFTFASYVYLLEVADDPRDPWRAPAGLRERLGYAVAVCNLLGSILYLVGSLCYFVHAPEHFGPPYAWEFLADEWGVRFAFGVGSLCFILGSVCAFPEILSDFEPKGVSPTPMDGLLGKSQQHAAAAATRTRGGADTEDRQGDAALTGRWVDTAAVEASGDP